MWVQHEQFNSLRYTFIKIDVSSNEKARCSKHFQKKKNERTISTENPPKMLRYFLMIRLLNQ